MLPGQQYCQGEKILFSFDPDEYMAHCLMQLIDCIF